MHLLFTHLHFQKSQGINIAYEISSTIVKKLHGVAAIWHIYKSIKVIDKSIQVIDNSTKVIDNSTQVTDRSLSAFILCILTLVKMCFLNYSGFIVVFPSMIPLIILDSKSNYFSSLMYYISSCSLIFCSSLGSFGLL